MWWLVPVAAAVASILPAVVSYRWLEQPLRSRETPTRASFVRFLSCVAGPPLVIAGAVTFVANDVWMARYAAGAVPIAHHGDIGHHDFEPPVDPRLVAIAAQVGRAGRQRIGERAVKIDTAALLIYRSAWTKDVKQARVTRESAMAKLYATDTAQEVIDEAVQIWGGQGVVSGNKVEELYREIRALRIYEGTSEIQKLVIAGQTMAAAEA